MEGKKKGNPQVAFCDEVIAPNLFHAVFLAEFFHTTRSIDDFLLTCVERMAL